MDEDLADLELYLANYQPDLLVDFPSDPFWTAGGKSTSTGAVLSTLAPASAPVPIAPAPPGSIVPSDTPHKLRSCAACRLRRVKCERASGQTDCVDCTKKGLVCTQLPQVKRRAAGARSGKRLDQARELFGTTAGDGLESTISNKRARSDDGAQVAKNRSRPPELHATSVVGRLITTELEGALASSLLELYLLLPQSRIRLLESTSFRSQFESSGRRPSQMDPASQVLLSVVMALSARVSDHPLLVGASAPNVQELAQATKEGWDLSEWGKRRAGACEALAQKAIALADEHGTMRTPSVESIAGLLMIEGMEETTDNSLTSARTYAAGYMGHLRVILESATKEEHDNLMGSGLGWTSWIRDCVLSAAAGRTPAFSDDDIFLLYEVHSGPLPPLREIISQPGVTFGPLFHAFLLEIGKISCDTSKNLTGVRPRSLNKVDEAFIRELFQRQKTLRDVIPMLEECAQATLGPPSNEQARSLWTFIRILRLTRCSQVLLVWRVLRQRLPYEDEDTIPVIANMHGLSEFPKLLGPALDDPYWLRVHALHDEAKAEAFAAGREIIECLELTMQSGVPLGVFSGTQLVFHRLPIWLSLLTTTPAAEEGGPSPSFTFAAKLNDLRWVLKALHSLGWAYASIARPVPWLREQIALVERKQAQYVQLMSGLEPSSLASIPASPASMPWSSLGSNLFDTSPTSTIPDFSEQDIEEMISSLTQPLYTGDGSDSQGGPPASGFGSVMAARPFVNTVKEQDVDNEVVSMLSNLLS